MDTFQALRIAGLQNYRGPSVLNLFQIPGEESVVETIGMGQQFDSDDSDIDSVSSELDKVILKLSA